jgi:hypothetical protein
MENNAGLVKSVNRFDELVSTFQRLNDNLLLIRERITGVSRRIADSIREPDAKCPEDYKMEEPKDLVTKIRLLLSNMESCEVAITIELDNIEKAV